MEHSRATGTQAARRRCRVCAVDEIADKGGVLADVGGREIGVFRHAGDLHAYDNRCIQQGGPICSGEILGATRRHLGERGEVVGEVLSESEMRLICPWDGWEYDLTTGEAGLGRADQGEDRLAGGRA